MDDTDDRAPTSEQGGRLSPKGRMEIERVGRFTTRARQVITHAQEEAARFQHNYLGTEHLLLGLIREVDGVAAKALKSLGIELEAVRNAVETIIGRGDRPVTGDIDLTPRAKRVVELAADEARRFGHLFLGTEHLLLGLIREGEGVGAGVLESFGLKLKQVRYHVIGVLTLQPGQASDGASGGGIRENVVTCRIDDRDLFALDSLVEAGIRSTRSEAASWLIHAGIAANQPLFQQVAATVAEIRRLRDQAQAMVQQLGPPDLPATPQAPSAPPEPAPDPVP